MQVNNTRPSVMVCLLLAGVLFVAVPAGSYAQNVAGAMPPTGGTVTGHVRGPGGAAVPGATVLLIESSSGERKETWTDESGNYNLSGLNPGTYRLEVSLLGFQTDVRQPVPVAAGKSLKVNVALIMGLPEQSAAASGGRSGGIPNLQSLPPEVRERLRNLGGPGGVGAGIDAASGWAEPSGGTDTVRFANAGQENPAAEADSSPESASASSSFLLAGSVTQAPTPGNDEAQIRERIQQFREQQQQQQNIPGFGGHGQGGTQGQGRGQSGGGDVFIGGPGSGGGGFGGGGLGGAGFGGLFMMFAGRGQRPQVNRIRGSLMERYSNSALDARDYPLNIAESPRIAYYSEQLGASIGGPLVIPRIYAGADKTTFFINYGMQRSKSPFDSFATVPTAAERAGDFSHTVIPSGPLAGSVPVTYDPSSNPPVPRTAFPGNIIPASRLDPAAVRLLSYIPLPNLPGAVQNFHLQEALPSDSDRLMVRIGHRVSAKDNVNALYFFNSARSDSVGNFSGLTGSLSVRSQNLNLGETHTFGSHIVNTLMFNFSRQRRSTLNAFAFKQNIAGDLGIQGISQDPRDWGLPLINYTNFTGLNDVIPSLVRNQTARAVDILIVNHNKHNLRLGGEIRRVGLNTLTDPDARGTFTFSGYTTSDFTSQGFPIPGTGFDLADFLLGLPQVTSVRFGTSANYLRSWVYAGFAQDDWRFSSRLTFNLGLRYEYFRPFTEEYGHLADLAVGPGFSSVGVVTGLDPGSLPDSLLRGDRNNFAPRVGIAFRPWTKRQVVLRAGYGLFYDGSIYQRLTPNLVNQPPFAQASTLITNPSQVLTLENGFPEIAPTVTRNTYAVDPNFRTPYGQTWNFLIEDELARHVVLDVGYLGTKGTHLDLLLAPNPVAPNPTSSTGQIKNALPFEYETSGASSIYHALQVGLRRQFHSGLSLRFNYTFSKSIDDASSVGGTGDIVAQDYLDLGAERGLSVFDVRHKFAAYYTWELPFGERRRYLTRGGLLARLLGDWQVSGNTQVQSGTPFTARVLGNQSNNSGVGAYGSQRADATGEPVSLPGSQQSTLRFFNTGAFTLPPSGQFGNAGRNTIPGPGLVNFNASLGRFITISQEKGLDFRVEANNLFNTPNYAGLATVVNATNFGRVTSVGDMRTLQFVMRLRF